ncbi:MAG TPA: hypothetical protein VHX13_02480 [Acidobacteriaceae bacterium]|jgi:hypothetical protein|nr:hypothetical protein [Acidobacteriaceae bacterium]
MMLLLMSVASAAGAGCAGLVFLLLKMRGQPRRKAALFAFLFPPVAMAFVLACLVLSSALSVFPGTPDLVFGDIHEKLPNGYTLDALDKMPECGVIQNTHNPSAEVAWVDTLGLVDWGLEICLSASCGRITGNTEITGRRPSAAESPTFENAVATRLKPCPFKARQCWPSHRLSGSLSWG